MKPPSESAKFCLWLLVLVLPFCNLKAATYYFTGGSVTLPRTSSNLRVHFIDIGPGDAILIETPGPNGKHIFIDGGKFGWKEVLGPYLRYFVSSNNIDLAIVTHADSDHFGGMAKVFQDYSVREYWDTGYQSPKLGVRWKEFKEAVLQEPGCKIVSPMSHHTGIGHFLVADPLKPETKDDDVSIQIINVNGNPPDANPETNRKFKENEVRNYASLVIKLIYKDVSFLLTGDINGRLHRPKPPDEERYCDSVEEFLVELHNKATGTTKGFLRSTLLKVPHHGSDGSSSLPFIEAVRPEWVVFSAGHEYNHPEPKVLERYRNFGIPANRIFRTDSGDSTPEKAFPKDPRGDDTYVFETDGESIKAYHRIKM